MALTDEQRQELRTLVQSRVGGTKADVRGGDRMERLRGIVEQQTTQPVSETKPESKLGASIRSATGIEETPGDATGILQELGSGFNRLAEQFQKRIGNFTQSFQKSAAGEISPVRTGLTALGQTAGFLGDVVGEAVFTDLEVITPEILEDAIKSGARRVFSTEAGQSALRAIDKGATAYGEWAEENPDLAMDLESVVNIASLLPIGRTRTGVKALGEVAGAAERGIGKKIATQTIDEALDIVKPVLKKGERIEAFATGRGVETGPLKRIGLTPTTLDRAVAESAADVVSKSKSQIANIDAIGRAIDSRASTLRKEITALDRGFDQDMLLNNLLQAKEGSKVVFAGDTTLQNAYDNVVNLFMEQIDGKRLEELWDARIDFDKEIMNRFGAKMLAEEAGDRARNNAIKDVRNVANQVIDEAAGGDIAFKKRIRDVSNLFTARDNISAQIQALLDSTVFTRALKKVSDSVSFKNTLVATGILSVGAFTGALSNPLILAALAGGGTLKIGSNVLTSRGLKQVLQVMLRETEQALIKGGSGRANLLLEKEAIEELIEALQENEVTDQEAQ
jgi:hypothetical protein